MFIVKKKISGKEYFYLRETKRQGKKVISKTIAYLGKNKKEAEEKMQKIKNKKKQPEIMKKEMESTESKKKLITIEEIASFCKRKGFVFPSSEIYGGLAGFWDFGPLGVELFNNIKQNWWKFFIQEKENMLGIDASIISHPRTWKASGHVTCFSDVSVVCKKCKKYNKVDKNELEKAKCGFCSGELDKISAKDLNLMFKTNIGPLEENSLLSYLRPETAQGMFMDFKLVQETSRIKLPFGIAQIGKCFRNEIAPRDFLFRVREFHIGEFEFFIHPDEFKCNLLEQKHLKLKIRLLDKETQEKGKEELREITIGELLKEKRADEWHAYWLAEQVLWYKELGINTEKIKIREHKKTELSHYSSATFDLDYEFPFGSMEIAGNANRTQFDLTQHSKESKQELDYFDENEKKRIVPRVIEPTFGMERAFLAVIVDGYCYDEKRQNIILKINPKLAPIKAAVFPIVKGKEYEKIAREIYLNLKKEFSVRYDESGSIGRRYARMDEIGCPICIAVDKQSLKDKTITLRDRDTTEQIRVKIKDVRDVLRKVIIEGEDIFSFGKKINTRVK